MESMTLPMPVNFPLNFLCIDDIIRHVGTILKLINQSYTYIYNYHGNTVKNIWDFL